MNKINQKLREGEKGFSNVSPTITNGHSLQQRSESYRVDTDIK
jgi:hypothetical protein